MEALMAMMREMLAKQTEMSEKFDKHATETIENIKQHTKELIKNMDENFDKHTREINQNLTDSKVNELTEEHINTELVDTREVHAKPVTSGQDIETNTLIDVQNTIVEQDVIIIQQESMEVDSEIINITNEGNVIKHELMEIDTDINSTTRECNVIKQDVILGVTYQKDSHIHENKHTQKQSTIIATHAAHIIRKATARNRYFARRIKMRKVEHKNKNNLRRTQKTRRKSYNKNKYYNDKYTINKNRHARSARGTLHHTKWTERDRLRRGKREKERDNPRERMPQLLCAGLKLTSRLLPDISRVVSLLSQREPLCCVKHTINAYRVRTRVNNRK